MSRERYARSFEVLELTPAASLAEVRNSYLHLRSLYSKDSIVISPIIDEFSEDSMQSILGQIEEAYLTLVEVLNEEEMARKNAPPGERPAAPAGDARREEISRITSFSGPVLKEIREKLSVGLYDIALATNVRMTHLENIERERYEALPPEVYLRGFVRDYARHLSLDADKVAGDYMERYRAWKQSAGS